MSAKQEKALLALLACGEVKRAAKESKLGEATLWRWLQEPAFQKQYRAARRQLVEGALSQLQSDGTKAAKVLLEIAQNKKAPASARVSAAKTIIEQSIKGVEQLDTLERIEALEQMMKTKGKRP
ncbi:MAG TPA: hypothetical protein VF791_04195 [Pyrinomonadaceae bacterium]